MNYEKWQEWKNKMDIGEDYPDTQIDYMFAAITGLAIISIIAILTFTLLN